MIRQMSLTAMTVVVGLSLAAKAETTGDTKPRKKAGHATSLHDEFTGQGYGVAGCGLGSVAFGPKPGPIQIIAATLNGTSGSQTFGISSGTSNCDIPAMGQQTAAFIEVNHEAVANDAARGQGETMAGLAFILNCSDAKALGQALRQNYEKIFASGLSSYDSTRAILSTISSDTNLKMSCQTQG